MSGWELALRSGFVRVAMPLALSVADPIAWPLDMNFTVPVGTTEPDEVTVAVQVTLCPKSAGFRLEIRAVDEVNLPTVVLFSKTPIEVWAQTLALSAHWFATNKSGLPSPFTSATATQLVKKPPAL